MITVIPEKNPGISDFPEVVYAPVVDGEKINCLAETEDVALILGLGRKYDGHNSQFAKMACRMLDIKTLWRE